MQLLTYVAPKFSAHQLEILERHMPSASSGLSMEYQQYSFNVLSNALRFVAENYRRVEAVYQQDYR